MKSGYLKSVQVFFGIFFLVSLPAFSQGSETVLLEKPPEKLDVDLMTAFRNRHSVKEYEKKEITLKDLGTVLWAGNGINRENGKRTAPAPKSFPLVQIYAMNEKGVFIYEPKDHSLRRISDKNVKDKVAKQAYLADASHILVLVVDPKLFTDEATPEKKYFWGGTTAGCIAQNIYLAADALKLGTAIVESMNADSVKEALQLKADEVPVYLMPLGYPKTK